MLFGEVGRNYSRQMPLGNAFSTAKKKVGPQNFNQTLLLLRLAFRCSNCVAVKNVKYFLTNFEEKAPKTLFNVFNESLSIWDGNFLSWRRDYSAPYFAED